MTEARIARVYPDLPEPLALVALFGETLGMAREMKVTRLEVDAAKGDAGQVAELVLRTGLEDEIEAAEKTATTTIVELLARVSEGDLRDGRDRGLLSPEDYGEVLTAKRTLSLQQSRAQSDERDRER